MQLVLQRGAEVLARYRRVPLRPKQSATAAGQEEFAVFQVAVVANCACGPPIDLGTTSEYSQRAVDANPPATQPQFPHPRGRLR